ncbi:porin family protein [Bremerella cremea]|uniref:porin family protein n=1 Tax=Bremerella cremea TaxID=1031537 RepID=UPI0031ED3DD6
MIRRYSIRFSMLLAIVASGWCVAICQAQEELPTANAPIMEGVSESILDAEVVDVEPKRIYETPGSSESWFGGTNRKEYQHRFDFVHGHPDDPARHIGWGQPLQGMSWRNRPFHFDAFAGTIMLQNLIPGDVEQSGAFFDGFRLGYDFDHYWGTEVRLGFAQGRLIYPTDTTFSGKSQLVLLDYNVQFYPWGDTKWRPYATIGLGAAVFQYEDVLGRARDQSQVSMPFGLGLKYFLHKRVALRFELLDNLALGGTDAVSSNNFSVSGGFEYRFGGTGPSYYR